MNLENALASDDVRVRHGDLAIEAAGTQQRGVKHVRPVCGGDEDDPLVGLEAVHLDEELVQRLLALVVAAAEARATMATDGVDLVDEDDAGRVLLGLLEHVADTAGADADEHLDEVRTRDGEEGDVGLAGDGASQQGLAGAGRADQQHAARDTAAETLELLRITQELHDLLQVLLGLVDARHILESDAAVGFGEELGLGLAEAHRLAAGALHLARHEDPDADEGEQRQPVDQQCHEPGIAVRRRLGGDLDVLLVEVLDQRRIVRRIGREGAATIAVVTGDLVPGDSDVMHLVGIDLVQQLAKGDVGRLLAPIARVLEQKNQRHHEKEDDHPKGEVPEIGVHFGLVSSVDVRGRSKMRLRPKATLLWS